MWRGGLGVVAVATSPQAPPPGRAGRGLHGVGLGRFGSGCVRRVWLRFGLVRCYVPDVAAGGPRPARPDRRRFLAEGQPGPVSHFPAAAGFFHCP